MIGGRYVSPELAESIVGTVREALVVLDGRLRVVLANRSFHRTFRVGREETARARLFDLGGGHWETPELRALLAGVLRDGSPLEDFEVDCEFRSSAGR